MIKSKEYQNGYNDAYQDANIRGFARLLPAYGTDYAKGYAAGWKVYGQAQGQPIR